MKKIKNKIFFLRSSTVGRSLYCSRKDFHPNGEKFGGTIHPTRRTIMLITRRAARPLFSQTVLPILGNDHPKSPKVGEPLREMLSRAVLSQALLTQVTKLF